MTTPLTRAKQKIESLQETLDELSERPCASLECNGKIKANDEAFCEDCSAGADCDKCGNEIFSGLCNGCHEGEVEAAQVVAIGAYPHIGINLSGFDVNDQILAFLAVVSETCCKAEPKPCPRCTDAVALHAIFTKHLGEVRA